MLSFEMADIGRSFQVYIEQVRLLFVQCKELDRVLGEEVQYLQYLVLGFLRQEEDVWAWLQNYMDVISERINRILEPAVNAITTTTTSIDAEWPGVLIEYTDACVALNILVDPIVGTIQDIISAMSSDANQNFPSTRQHLANLRNVILNAGQVAADSLVGTPLAGNFNLLADSIGLREVRTRRTWLREVALRDIRRISPNSNLREVVQEWLALLATHEELAGVATREERRAIRSGAAASLSQLPGLAGFLRDWDDGNF